MRPILILLLLSCLPHGALAQDSDLAKKLSNPVASLISVPFQGNYDTGFGAEDGDKAALNIQPVIPVSIGEDWNLISRTILPLVRQNDISGKSGTQTGLGDTLQSLFFSPKEPTSSGLIWGVGPALLLPTATDDLLGGDTWAAGPTAVGLRQSGPWTYGLLANHVWSYAGPREVNASFLQPFLSYTTADAWTYTLNSETTYDWEADRWTAPVNAVLSKLVRFGDQPVSLQAGLRYWVDSPESGPDGIGARLGIVFLFPK